MVADGSSGDIRLKVKVERLCTRVAAGLFRHGLARGATVLAVVAVTSLAAETAAAQSAAAQTDTAWDRGIWGRPVVESAPAPDTSPREILLGTITTRRAPLPRQSDVANQILADGLEALHRGDVMLGRRRLEAVIDAYPESPAAATAREELGVLYNLRGRSVPRDAQSEPVARWVPAQNVAPSQTAPEQGVTPLRRVDEIVPEGRNTFSREARARERQSRRDERWLRALSGEFQAVAGDRVFFAENSTDIGARARAALAAQARWLARHPGVPVVIEAHADDSRGNRDFDVQIAERRGRAVQDRLADEGIDPSRITVVAFGHDRPVATCQMPECAAQNRRVIVRLGNLTGSESERRSLNEPAFAGVPPVVPPARRD